MNKEKKKIYHKPYCKAIELEVEQFFCQSVTLNATTSHEHEWPSRPSWGWMHDSDGDEITHEGGSISFGGEDTSTPAKRNIWDNGED